ncbi:hypothetical protein LG943_25480 [Streptomonospora sp. S1-112]|uniref:Uncharacterized protein n=1 Tax=Streptomonospora mangrovi TaxID=2883123 RepID=A0A9X3NSQ9_9ACTN|nr:hypothetical protein [Streptomonospora mangrovi]MDA0567648.1 hypothetical protein [Streptomonospora mangrovi]
MELIGMPWVAIVRTLGPPLVVGAVGAIVLARRRPPGARLMWGALAVQLAAAALPVAWLLVQVGAGVGGHSAVGLVMILLQPAVEALAWLMAVAAVAGAVPRRPRAAAAGDAPAGVAAGPAAAPPD